jgi:glycosyltransferase involved in cell wall biosynthesis
MSAGPLVEILIPTLNEARHIPDAVRNAAQLGPVFVLDSFSTDGTQELARQAGAACVVEHAFINYSQQKNWGLDNLPFRGEWVFILDADERLTPALLSEVRQTLANNPPIDGYFVNRSLIFMGRRVQHGGLYPSWNLRLLRRGRARYEDRSVHEHVVCDGPTAHLRHEMLHIRDQTMAQNIAKHIRYADMESDEWVKRRLGQSSGASTAALFGHRDRLRYRQWLRRHVWPLVPVRPMWRFLYMYLLRLGFLDGRAGWHQARLMATYEYMISLLYREKLTRIGGRKGSDSVTARSEGVAQGRP